MQKINHNKIATEVFKNNPVLSVCHITSDGTPFGLKNHADNHAKTLDDKSIETIEKPFNKTKGKTVSDVNLITGEQFQKAIDLKVLSYNRGIGYSFGKNNLGASKKAAMNEINLNSELASTILDAISNPSQRGTEEERIAAEEEAAKKAEEERIAAEEEAAKKAEEERIAAEEEAAKKAEEERIAAEEEAAK